MEGTVDIAGLAVPAGVVGGFVLGAFGGAKSGSENELVFYLVIAVVIFLACLAGLTIESQALPFGTGVGAPGAAAGFVGLLLGWAINRGSK
jgi:hypothetical protein